MLLKFIFQDFITNTWLKFYYKNNKIISYKTGLTEISVSDFMILLKGKDIEEQSVLFFPFNYLFPAQF